MRVVAQVLGQFVTEYFSQVLGDRLESRLLVPAPTAHVGRELQEALTESLPPKVLSLLVVDGEGDAPSESKGWILAAGLTSKRIGSFSVVTQPGQLSRIQESVVGSGGAVRQAFEDEWPWVRNEENELFSFPTLFLPAIVRTWTDSESHQAWITNFIWKAIVPAVRESPYRASYLFDELLSSFDPGAHPECGDTRQRFLYHCGVPETEDLGIDPHLFIRDAKRLCQNVARRMQSMSRAAILENASTIEEKHEELRGAINTFFDSAGSHNAQGIEVLAIAHCLRGLSPSDWKHLDCETLARLFEFQERSQLTIDAKIVSTSGLVSPSEKDVVDTEGCILAVDISWAIEGSEAKADDYLIELKHGQRQLYSTVLSSKSGQESITVDTASDLSSAAKKITLTARIVDRRDPVDPQHKASSVRVHVLRDSRPCCVVLQEPFLVFDANTDADEEFPDGATLTDPTFVFAVDSRKENDYTMSAAGEQVSLVTANEFSRRMSSPVDPSLEPSGQILIEADFGEVGKVWLNLESSGTASGELNIEDELIRQLKAGRRNKISQLCERFSGSESTPYPALGGISEENEVRIRIAKEMESGDRPETPIILDFSVHPESIVDQGIVRACGTLVSHTSIFADANLEDGPSNLIRKYRDARRSLLQLYLDHFGDDNSTQMHPLCSRAPAYIESLHSEIEALIQDYIQVYIEILDELKKARWTDWPTVFLLTFLDCVVGAQNQKSLKYPLFLLGPWHPLIIAQRYQRQAALYASARRFVDKRGSLNQMAGLFYELDSLKRIHAIADTAMHFENAYVSNTSDPNWGLAMRVGDSKNFDGLTSGLGTILGLEAGAMPRGSEALTQSYVKRFLEANPAERRLEIRVRKGLNNARILSALEGLLYDRTTGEPSEYGRQLPGGIHLYLEHYDPHAIGKIEWRYPPICIYHNPEETEQDCLDKHNIDIVIVAPERSLDFKGVSDKLAEIPRGAGIASAISTTVTWLEQTHTGVASTICHEIDDLPRNTGSVVTDAFILASVSIGNLVPNDFYTVRPLDIPRDIRASWIVIPGYNADPSAFIQYVADSSDGENEKVLWEYNIDLEERRSEYFILSEVPPGFRHALSATTMAKCDLGSIVHDLGSIGIAIGSESLKTGTKALGVIGQIGAARLLCRLADADQNTSFPLSDSEQAAGLLLPVDSFDTLLGSTSKDTNTTNRKSDLLAIQLRLPNGESSPLLISATSVECKFTGRIFPSNDVPSALDQARQTYTRFEQLVLGSRDNDGIIERLVLCRLIRYGLQLRRTGLRGASVSLGRDSKILKKILRGNVEFMKPTVDRMLVSTECELGTSDAGFDGRYGGLWIRLSADAWPGINEEADSIRKIRSKLSDLFGAPVEAPAPSAQERTQETDTKSPQSGSPSKSSIKPEPTVEGRMQYVLPIQPPTEPDLGILDPATESPDEYQSGGSDDQGVKFVIGKELDAFPETEYSFWPSNTALNQLNLGIVGDLGTGKTQLVMALMLQMHRSKPANQGRTPKFLIFDYKGDYTKPEFVEAVGATVVKPKHIPLNFFDSTAPSTEVVDPAVERARFAFDTLKKIYGGLGPVQQMNLRSAIKEGYRVARSAGLRAPTISDVSNEYSSIVSGKPDSMLAIISGLVDNQIFETDSSKLKSLDELFQSTLVLDLKALGQDDDTKNMLVAIFLNIYYEYMLSLEKRPFFGPDKQLRSLDSILVVDEADSIMKYNFPILKTLLLQGREFGVGVWLASQYLSHFRTKEQDYKQPLLTWFIHKVPNISAKELSEIGMTNVNAETAERVKTLQLFECLYKSFDVSGRFVRGHPFFELMAEDDG